MEFVIVLKPDLAAEMRRAKGGKETAVASELRSVLDSHRLSLTPVDEEGDSPLAKYFTVHTEDGILLDRIADQLRRLSGVETVYSKPVATPP